MKNILPYNLSPTIKTYLNQSYPFGIVEAHFGKNVISDLVCNNYINCISNLEDNYIFCQYPEDGWFEKNGIINKETFRYSEKNKECLNDIVSEIQKRISNGHYVLLKSKRRYNGAISDIAKYDSDYEIFLYGIDTEVGVYYSVMQINDQYVSHIISYTEYEGILSNMLNGDMEISFYSVNKEYSSPELEMYDISDKLSDYLNSYIPELSDKTNSLPYKFSDSLKCGISVWDELLSYFEKIKLSHMQLDMHYPNITASR